jgi:hypothetical protein
MSLSLTFILYELLIKFLLLSLACPLTLANLSNSPLAYILYTLSLSFYSLLAGGIIDKLRVGGPIEEKLTTEELTCG